MRKVTGKLAGLWMDTVTGKIKDDWACNVDGRARVTWRSKLGSILCKGRRSYQKERR